eukprot:258185_1
MMHFAVILCYFLALISPQQHVEGQFQSNGAVACYDKGHPKVLETLSAIKTGLSLSEKILSTLSLIPPLKPLKYVAYVPQAADYIIGLYGSSITDTRSMWKCMDAYLDMLISEIYGDVASFESTSAKQIVNDLLKPTNNLAINYDPETFTNNICDVIRYYMNHQSFASWDLCTTVGCDSRLDIQYYYLAVPYLIQYNNLRFDTMSWLYNTSSLLECQGIKSNFDANFELYSFFQDNVDLFQMYLSTYPYLMNDMNKKNSLNVTERNYYYAAIYGTPNILCRWFTVSFGIYEATLEYQSANNLSLITFDLDWSDYAGHDFSAFKHDCPATLLAWQMSYNSKKTCVKKNVRKSSPISAYESE